MQLITLLLIFTFLNIYSAARRVQKVAQVVQIHKRAVTYAATCTNYNTSPLLQSPTLLSSTCTYQASSGPYVTVDCYGGLINLNLGCGAPVTASTCSSITSISTLYNIFGSSTGTTRISTTACAKSTFPPSPATTSATTSSSTTTTTLTTTSTTSTSSSSTTSTTSSSTTSISSSSITNAPTTTASSSTITTSSTTTSASPIASCFADNISGKGRTLSSASTSSSSMTNAFCQSFCNQSGYAYSGTEYSNECYCGTTAPTVGSAACTMTCAASGSTEICGGSNALTVSFNSTVAAAVSQSAAVVASFTSQGCYSDAYPTRVLSGASTTSTAMFVSLCINFCNNAGFVLAGVEYGNECYCGNAISSDGSTYGVGGQSGCTYTCSGSSEICGGSNYLNLYSKGKTVASTTIASSSTTTTTSSTASTTPFKPQPTTASTYTSVACYSDSSTSRTLISQQAAVSSVEACVAACSSGGFKYAGVEYGSECWCDNQIRSTTILDPKNCNMPCQTASETCGGSFAIQIYSGTSNPQISIPTSSGSFNYVDSYTDSSSNRLLPAQFSISSTTVANCVSTCSNNAYKYAGLEYGSQCFCGTSLPGTVVGGQTPTMACQGNSAQYCGGPNVLQVYLGTPAPQSFKPPFTNGQCVSDNVNARTLPVAMPATSNMTPAICRAACSKYTYYGVEYSNECYCGNSFAAGTTLSTSCNMACVGDSTQTCGGSSALNIYNS